MLIYYNSFSSFQKGVKVLYVGESGLAIGSTFRRRSVFGDPFITALPFKFGALVCTKYHCYCHTQVINEKEEMGEIMSFAWKYPLIAVVARQATRDATHIFALTEGGVEVWSVHYQEDMDGTSYASHLSTTPISVHQWSEVKLILSRDFLWLHQPLLDNSPIGYDSGVLGVPIASLLPFGTSITPSLDDFDEMSFADLADLLSSHMELVLSLTLDQPSSVTTSSFNGSLDKVENCFKSLMDDYNSPGQVALYRPTSLATWLIAKRPQVMTFL